MATPESRVKTRVKKILEKYPNAYRTMPVTGGFGNSGVPDFIACINGKFVAVECKANGNKPTALQKKNLNAIVEAGGYGFVVDDSSIGVFILSLDNVVHSAVYPRLYDFTSEENPSKDK